MDSKILNENEVFLLVIDSKQYNNLLIDFIKKQLKNKKVCFVTTNKSYYALLEIFKKEKIKLKDFYFIDAVTKVVVNAKNEENCLFLSSPQAITEMNLAISDAIKKNFDIIIVDSLTTFLVYHKSGTLEHFFHNLINQTKNYKSSKLFLAISDKDNTTELYNKLSLMVDSIVELK